MLKLNDTQAVLLSAASHRDGGNVHPLPDTLAEGARVTKALTMLAGAGLVEERETADAAAVSRTDGDLRYGLFITAAGLQALSIDDAGAGTREVAEVRAAVAAPAPERISKTAAVLALLGREAGATMGEIIAATGWLPHTTRAALTGLRKKGHAIVRGKRDGETCYRVEAA
jgi:hypothetical protein